MSSLEESGRLKGANFRWEPSRMKRVLSSSPSPSTNSKVCGWSTKRSLMENSRRESSTSSGRLKMAVEDSNTESSNSFITFKTKILSTDKPLESVAEIRTVYWDCSSKSGEWLMTIWSSTISKWWLSESPSPSTRVNTCESQWSESRATKDPMGVWPGIDSLKESSDKRISVGKWLTGKVKVL